MHVKNVMDKLLIRTSFILETGLLLFIVAIAGRCILQAKEGIKTGTYYLIVNRGAGFTKVSWSSEPVRFAIYSIGFIGFPIWSIYFTLKTIRSFMKKS